LRSCVTMCILSHIGTIMAVGERMTISMHAYRLTARLGRCFACGRPVAAHFDANNAYVGCLPLAPMTVTLPSGATVTVRTVADVYRVAAFVKKAA